MRNQSLIGISLLVLGVWMAYEVGGKIAVGDMRTIAFVAFIFAGCVVAVTILRNWRTGFYFFLTWLLFEDLARKYMGNNMALFFGKDALALLTYISLFAAIRAGREKTFRPKFLLFLVIFIWLGLIQIFNPNSPHVLYGILGFKIYFFYVPLMYVGYALIRNDEDLRKFLAVNAVLAGTIATLGIIQAIVGHSFLNPTNLAPELRDLGELDKVSPLTNQILSLPTAVFVSSGRFAGFLIIAAILMIGASGYLLLYTRRSRTLVFVVTGIVGGAILFSGSRGAVVYGAASVPVLAMGFLWGAPWRWRQAHRLTRAIRRSLIGAAFGLAAIVFIFPTEIQSRLAFYEETLSPSSSAYEVSHRTWDYPIQNLMLAFTNPNWPLGNGIGLASLGTQYVGKLLHERPPNIWVEEGYGQLIIEMGIVAPFLWILWTAALLYYMWRVLLRLRQTRFFPVAFAIFWYAFLLLYPFTYGGLAPYQNYVGNAYLWLLVGIFFSLPDVLAATPAAPVLATSVRERTRGGFQF
ncbi:MAG: hypothetical protein ACRD59_09400 [Candidatus Acidiferrales bacterium]